MHPTHSSPWPQSERGSGNADPGSSPRTSCPFPHPACRSHVVRDFESQPQGGTHRLPKWTRLDLGRINVQDGVRSCATSPARSSRAWRGGEEEEVGFSSFREGNATKSLEPGHILHLTHQFKRRAAQPARMWARKRWEALHLQFWGRLLVAMRPCSQPSLPQEGNLSTLDWRWVGDKAKKISQNPVFVRRPIYPFHHRGQ
jgi:hypothetical protein